ncbi:di-heme oxidoredictase family protein [Aurantibacillus circumpalustris]|uniref:di-heme oxidoredictase family protein n=1 Tax=Aurantibacillus circumpalustris TaxID=3036359 RepID=UPI00295A5E91|nr:di-heme oxidoredictase family protein [Aurantibacillus circumpalustris]
MKKIIFALLLFGTIIAGCKKIMPSSPKEDELLDGPVEGLTTEETHQFLLGDGAFNNEIFTTQNGLGPIFVANSCGSCHAGDGKGHPFTTLTRFGQTDSTGNKYLSLGGPQLQNRALPGYTPETLPSDASFSKVLPPANTGLGFLDAVSDADLLAMSDPNDLDGDGISGIPNWVSVPNYCQLRPNAISQNGKYIARFGKKGAAYDLLQQTANAYNQDMGITSSFEPYDTYSKLEVDPEVNNNKVHTIVFYLKTLKAPIQRNQNNAKVQAGKQLFSSLGCEKCHRSELKTQSSTIAALSNKTFFPYTDLLLHDMGKNLDDNYTEGSAKTHEWKTPALWGLGLSKITQGGSYFLMHDGRAHSIEEAIQWHGGEAQQSNTNFQNLSTADQQKLIHFLESL